MSPDEMDGDLHQWGAMKEMDVTGLSALGFPSGQPETPSGAGIPVPNYFPNHQINALNRAIEGLESKYKNILIYKYACKLTDSEVCRREGCHRANVPRRIEKAKHLLVKSRYWKT